MARNGSARAELGTLADSDLTEDWNVVVTVRDDSYTHVHRVLERLGSVVGTPYYNVLVMRTDDIPGLLARLDELFAEEPWLADEVSRILPVTHTFSFDDAADFEQRARDVVGAWLDQLVGRSFHVRMHARGWTEEPSRLDEERLLDGAMLQALELIGESGHIAFDDADAVIDVETVGHRAGMALWTKDQLDRYRFLRID